MNCRNAMCGGCPLCLRMQGVYPPSGEIVFKLEGRPTRVTVITSKEVERVKYVMNKYKYIEQVISMI